MTSAERLAATGLILGEGPVPTATGFACVDIFARTVIEGTLDGVTRIASRFDETVSAVCDTATGDRIVAVGTHLEITGSPHRIDLPPRDPDLRLNDGKADPAGRFVCGTMADPPRPGAGALWSFSAGEAHLLLADVTISNGLAWSADGNTLFFVDTPTQRIDAFDYDVAGGTMDGRRPVAMIDATHGSPDGMAIDADGGLWVALWGGSAVHRYVDGRLDHVIEVPTPYVTCPAFVGDDLGTLLITTASEPIPGEPGAGDLYTTTPGVTGAPVRRASTARVFGSDA